MKIIEADNKIIVGDTPYNELFVDMARDLAGKFVNGSWVFDIRDKNAVLEACLYAYGENGIITNKCDIKVTLADDVSLCYCTKPFVMFGRTIARVYNRDSGAVMGDGVVVNSGGFTSGGSAKNYRVCHHDNTSFTLRDVSKVLVDEFEKEGYTIEIISVDSNICIDRNALIAELNQLEKRKEEIMLMLSTDDSSHNDDGIHKDLLED